MKTPRFECLRCDRIFKLKHHLKQHMNRKNICTSKNPNHKCDSESQRITDIESTIPIVDDINISKTMKSNNLQQDDDIKTTIPVVSDINIDKIIVNNYKCQYCNLSFSTNSNMNRHVRLYCKKKKEKEEIRIILEKHNDEINKIMEMLQLKGDVSPEVDERKSSIINIINNNNIVNNIQINKYGEETIDYVTPAFIRKIKTNSSLNGLLCLTNHIYCNSKHMDNCSVVVIDISHDRCKIKGNEHWETKSLKDVVEDNLVRTSCKMSDAVENAAADQGRERDEKGFPILDEFEKRLIDCYNQLNDEEYVKQIKEIKKKHKNCLIDHSDRNRDFFDNVLQNKQKVIQKVIS